MTDNVCQRVVSYCATAFCRWRDVGVCRHDAAYLIANSITDCRPDCKQKERRDLRYKPKMSFTKIMTVIKARKIKPPVKTRAVCSPVSFLRRTNSTAMRSK